jgi:hypothetical protein
MLPVTGNTTKMDRLMNILEMIAEKSFMDSRNHQRLLADYSSYFLFNDILEDFWNNNLPDKDRLFYFPIYFWWRVSVVIPLRPRELLLTPRDCISRKGSDAYVTLRRNNLKGSNKEVKYRISEDYYLVHYDIPQDLYDHINNYIEMTQHYEKNQCDTFLIADAHYDFFGIKKNKRSRLYTHNNFWTALRMFYSEVIEKKYGQRVVYDRENYVFETGSISFLYPGDTRHLALINIIAEGGGPVVAMSLAGHDNIETTSHYYTNIKSLIECNTYRQYRKVQNHKVEYSLMRRPTHTKNEVPSPLENGAKCYSPNYKRNDYSDCISVCGPEGEIGYCPSCSHYCPKNSPYISDDASIYLKRLEDHCAYLANIVNLYRRGRGDVEDIQQILKKLQNSCYSYQLYYQEKALHEREKLNGAR